MIIVISIICFLLGTYSQGRRNLAAKDAHISVRSLANYDYWGEDYRRFEKFKKQKFWYGLAAVFFFWVGLCAFAYVVDWFVLSAVFLGIMIFIMVQIILGKDDVYP